MFFFAIIRLNVKQRWSYTMGIYFRVFFFVRGRHETNNTTNIQYTYKIIIVIFFFFWSIRKIPISYSAYRHCVVSLKSDFFFFFWHTKTLIVKSINSIMFQRLYSPWVLCNMHCTCTLRLYIRFPSVRFDAHITQY